MHDRESEKVRDNAPLRAVETPQAVNWLPTVVMLGLFCWWVILAFFFYSFLPNLRDFDRTITYVLLAGVVVFAVPALVRQFAPDASVALRRSVVAFAYTVVAIPLVFLLSWSAYDAMTPVPVRNAGALPDMGAIMGRSPHDVARILGQATAVAKAELPAGDISDPSRPGGADAVRFVVYSLPDLNTIQQRPVKRASRNQEGQLPMVELGQSVDPRRWNSDALVIVYYSQDYKAVGVRTDVSMKSALAAISNVTSETVLTATGIQPEAADLTSSSAGDAEQGDTTAVPGQDFWGRGVAGTTALGYELQLGGLANFLSPRTTLDNRVGADQGDVTLVVAGNLVGPGDLDLATASVGSGGQLLQAVSSGEEDTLRLNKDSFADQQMWLVLASPWFKTEHEAVQRAKELNAGRSPALFSVERSGHFDGLGTSDFFFVMFDQAFLHEDSAHKAVAKNLSRMPVADIQFVHVTKRCGEFTLASVGE